MRMVDICLCVCRKYDVISLNIFLFVEYELRVLAVFGRKMQKAKTLAALN